MARYPHPARSSRAPVRRSPSFTWQVIQIALFCIGLITFGALFGPWLFAPLVTSTLILPTAGVPLPPTLAPAARDHAATVAPATDDTARMVQATPIPWSETAADAPPVSTIAPASYSPADLGWAPLPTPTSGLPADQFDAAQASEEQNQLNTRQDGLTEAQKLVQQHDATWNARQP